MKYELDPELAPAIAALAAEAAGRPRPARGDWRTFRDAISAGQANTATPTPASSGVTTTSFTTPTTDGEDEIELRWYAKTGAATGSAVVYTHGGGMLAGSLDLYDQVVCWYVAQTGVPFLSVGL
ncbi:MAG TPA: hypothetical protein VLM11_01085, partial [Streptosporangiaceae bacterium]|nr:hypothetical protein [Streptosporangiaceae bacterium]